MKKEKTLSEKIRTIEDYDEYEDSFIYTKDVKQFIKEILDEFKLECKPYDMLYGEVRDKKLSFEEIKQIIKQKAGDLVE